MKRIITWSIVITLLAAVMIPASPAQANAAQPQLKAVDVKLVPSDKGVLYQGFANRYIVGPDGWFEWHITVDRDIVNVARNTLYDLDRDGGWASGKIPHHRNIEFNRLIGDRTLVFRFTPHQANASGYIDLNRTFTVNSGSFGFTAPDSETGELKEYGTTSIDLNALGGMSRVYLKNEYPEVKVHPSPQYLQQIGQMNGLSVDKLIIDIHDQILDPGDFEFRYQFTHLNSNYKVTSEWIRMQERNEIPVPAEVRNKELHLFLEVRDRSGNYRPHTFYYPSRQDGGPSRISMFHDKVIAEGLIYGYIMSYENPGRITDSEKKDFYERAREDFLNLKEVYDKPQTNYPEVAIFIFSSGQFGMPGYRGFEDVDLSNSGFVWSKSENFVNGIDDPITPFDPEYIFKAEEADPATGRVYKGYWVVIPPDASAKLEDGTYYLYIRMNDAVTGGAKWQRVRYAESGEPVKLIRDTTPLYFELTEPEFGSDEYDIRIDVRDNAGIQAAQYMVSDRSDCLEFPQFCEDTPWVDIPLVDSTLATVTMSTYDLLPNYAGFDNFYVYVRALEQRHYIEWWYGDTDPFDDLHKDRVVYTKKRYYFVRELSSPDSFYSGNGMYYSPQESTRGPVTAYLYVGKQVNPDVGDGYSYKNGWLSYTFNQNGSHTFEAMDLEGNQLSKVLSEQQRTASVDWIHNDMPAFSLEYSTTEVTNQPVTVTLVLPGGDTVINNAGSNKRTFYDNDTFTFVVRDHHGLLHNIEAEVTNIDLTPPVIELRGNLMYPVYQGLPFQFEEPGYRAYDDRDGDLTAQVQVKHEIDVYKGGYYEIEYTVSDRAGNVAREVRGVPVYTFSSLQMFINGVRIRGDIYLPRELLTFHLAGQESGEMTLKYLPGRHKLGVFKEQGIPITGMQFMPPQDGWYTFYAQDKERKTIIGHVYVGQMP